MKRALPLIVALVIAVLAFGAAFGVNTALKLAVALPEGATLDEPGEGDVAVASAEPALGEPSTPLTRGLSRKQYIDAILERNIFDHTKIGLKSEGGGGEAITDLNVRLLATIVAEPAQFSSALIAEEGRDGKAVGYGIGDKLFDAEIVGIEQKKVTLKRSDGTIEVLTMEDKTDDAGPREPAAAAEPGGEEGISEVGENRFTVDRSLVDKYLTDIEAVSKMARAIPHRGPDGEIDGYRLSGIRRNSPLSQLGIRNGDVIHAVNGHSLSSMQDAMAAYQQLQGGSSFSFEVTRRGQRQTMEYEIR